jgi:hypothetical protein
MSTNDSLDILEILEKSGQITPTIRRMIESFAAKWRISPFHALLQTEVMNETALADALALALGIDRLFQVQSLPPAEEALHIIGFRRAREWECMAFQAESGRLDLTCADPTQKDRIGVLRRELNCELTLAVAERSDIVGAIDELFPLADQLPSLFSPTSVGALVPAAARKE